MVIKVNFTKPMLVLKIREVYKAPYHKTRYLNIRKRHLNSRKEFRKFLEDYTKFWSSGVYEIQHNVKEKLYCTFIRITVREGKVNKFWKESPYSKESYPLWNFVRYGRI